MNNLLNKYLFTSFSATFFPIFITLYIITSIIFLVKVAALTSIIQINFLELIELYSYSVPHILFYTLPISYFIGLTLSIAKLADENELIVLTSFGLNPLKIIKVFLPITFIVSITILIISLGLYPKAYQLKQQFLNIKKQEAKFNIKPSEYGQQFGSWLIYVDKETKEKYIDVTLLKIDKNKDTFISSNFATLTNSSNALQMKLSNGKSFVISDNIMQVDFEEMILSNKIHSIEQIKSFSDIILYWSDIDINKDKKHKFIFKILISIFPFISLFFIVTLGYFNPRYNSNHATSISSAIVITYIILAKSTQANIEYILPIAWIVISYLYYFFTTRKLY
jgi:lipopolysaccharide export system permease protein